MFVNYVVTEVVTVTEWHQALRLLHEVYVGGSFTDAKAASAMMNRESMEPAGVLLIARGSAGGEVLGATLFLHPDSSLRQQARDGEREFRLLAVSSEARGRGVGELLVQACIDRARSELATGLVLWTQPTMHAAQRLYERLGFTRAQDRDTPDPRGWNRMVYRKDLRKATTTKGLGPFA